MTMLPTTWWLFWWVLGVVVTVGLGIWFVRAARREDRDRQGETGDAPASAPPRES